VLAQALQNNEQLLPILYDERNHSIEIFLQSQETLQTLLAICFKLNPNPTFIVLDGLDELEESERSKMIKWLWTVTTSINQSHPGALKIFVTGREEGGLQAGLNMATRKRLCKTDTLKDMETYISLWSAKIQKSFKLPDYRRQDITRRVMERADGK
jgi:hypothetical protein